MSDKRRDNKGRILRKGELQRPDGRYMYRYTDSNGDRQAEYSWRLVETDPHPKGKKQELSLREKERLIEQNGTGRKSNISGNMTLNELFDHYVKMQTRRKKVKRRTVDNYSCVWNKNMRTLSLALMPIDTIRKTHILDAYQEMQENGVGNGSIILIHKVMNAMFNYAESEDMVRRNYVRGCTKELGIYNNKREALTQEQQSNLLAFIRDSEEFGIYYWMFVFFLETGCRCGEGIGLTWADVDFEKGFIRIDHQLIYGVGEEDSGMKLQIVPPKTIKGIRMIPLSKTALHALEMQKEYLNNHNMLDNHTIDGHSNFVFLTKSFQLWTAAQLDICIHRIIYAYNSIEVANGVMEQREPNLMPNISAHILRHTACTRMAESGMDQRTLQEIMGHQNLALTMKVYNHVDEKRMRNEMDKFDEKRAS